MRVLVTGGTGFIGGSLVRRLADSGHCTRALVRSELRAAPLRAWRAELSPGDLCDPESLRRATEGVDVVVHTAAWVGTGGDRREIEAVNLGGTTRLLEVAAAAGVKRFVHISSTGVYGALPRADIDESEPMRRCGLAYHDSKIGAEEAVLAERRMSTVRLRPSHVWGPASTHFTMRPLRMLLGGRVPLVGGGAYHFKPLHIDNLLDAIECCLEQSIPGNPALNVTDGFTRSWRELFEAYAGVAGVVPRYRNVPLPIARVGGAVGDLFTRLTGAKAPLSSETVRVLSSTNSYSNDGAKARLGWSPRVGWQDGMDSVGAWISRRGHAFFTGPALPTPLEAM